jgi:hypothetical protein
MIIPDAYSVHSTAGQRILFAVLWLYIVFAFDYIIFSKTKVIYRLVQPFLCIDYWCLIIMYLLAEYISQQSDNISQKLMILGLYVPVIRSLYTIIKCFITIIKEHYSREQ